MGETSRPSSHIIRLSDPGQRRTIHFALTPESGDRARLAETLGIPAIRKLRFEGTLVPQGRTDWQLEARLGATVVQDCVVTLEPVTTRIEEDVVRRYVAGITPVEADELEMPADDTVEELPPSLDLEGVMSEALALALPPYPRAEAAELGEIVVTEPGARPLTDEARRPFAGLRDALKPKD
jgi:uncharacterized metal-binding protein YceD (DUF177 family)